jgi:hypothetical protein
VGSVSHVRLREALRAFTGSGSSTVSINSIQTSIHLKPRGVSLSRGTFLTLALDTGQTAYREAMP